MKATFIMAALVSAFLATSQITAYAAKTPSAPPVPSKMFVAVYEFENRSTASANDVKTIRDRITDAVVNTRKFEVVERERIKTLMKEHNLAAMGVTDGKDAPTLGKMKAVGYGIYGCVLFHGGDVTHAHGEAGTGARFEYKVELQIRITNAETGKILLGQNIQSSGKVQKFASGDAQQQGNWSQQAMRDAVDAACREVVFLLLDQVCPVRVLAVGDEDITLNVSKGLVEEDDVFNVYEAPEYEEDPVSHEMIPIDGKQVGRVAITEAGVRYSKAVPVDWLKMRGKGANMKVTKMKACDVDSIERGMVLRKVSAATLEKEKTAEGRIKQVEFKKNF